MYLDILDPTMSDHVCSSIKRHLKMSIREGALGAAMSRPSIPPSMQFVYDEHIRIESIGPWDGREEGSSIPQTSK